MPQMILPLVVATVLLFSGLLAYGAAMHLIVRVMVRLIRSGSSDLGFWKSTAVMTIVMMITVAAHLNQIALWAAAFLVCGQVSTFETAFCLSAQNFTAFGYGNVVVSERWRLLSPLEATNGLLFFGMSTAVLFAIMSQLIANRLRSETGYQTEATGKWAPPSVAGDAWSS
jgi:Ion channel